MRADGKTSINKISGIGGRVSVSGLKSFHNYPEDPFGIWNTYNPFAPEVQARGPSEIRFWKNIWDYFIFFIDGGISHYLGFMITITDTSWFLNEFKQTTVYKQIKREMRKAHLKNNTHFYYYVITTDIFFILFL